MTWYPSEEYWAQKLKNIRNAIEETERTLATLTEQRQIDAHEAQIRSYKRSLAITWQRFLAWRKKHENIERGTRS